MLADTSFPNEGAYNRNFDFLSGAETVLLACVLLVFWRESSGRWKTFYACFCGAVIFNGVMYYILNAAIERGAYFTGSWYDIPYSGSFALFTGVSVLGWGLAPAGNGGNEFLQFVDGDSGHVGGAFAAHHRALCVVEPVLLPHSVADFRVLVTLATMFLMALVLFIQHYAA